MNKIYKVVWSKAKQCYVVASELAKSHTKTKKNSVFRRAVVTGIFGCLLNISIPVSVMAASIVNDIPLPSTGVIVEDLRISNTALNNLLENTALAGYPYSRDFDSMSMSYDIYVDSNGNPTLYGFFKAYKYGSDGDGGWELSESIEKTVKFTDEDLASLSLPISSFNGGTTYSASNGINISSDNKVSVKAGTNVTVDENGVSVTGNGSVASGNTGLINGGTAYSELRPSANGNYVKTTQTTAQNLNALDTQVKANATASGNAIKGLSASGTTITYTKNDGTTGTITTQDTKYTAGSGLSLSGTQFSVNTNGSVASGNTGVLNGGTVYSEVRPTADGTFVKKTNTTAANLTALDTASKNAIKGVSASGSTLTLTKGDGTTSTVTLADNDTKYTAGSGLSLSGTQFSVNTNGSVASGNTGVMSGGTVYSEVRPTADGTFVKKANTTAANLTALDTASKNAIKGLSVSGKTITYTKGDGSTGTITTQDTTYTAGSGLTLNGTQFSVNTNGAVASGNTGVLNGGTMYSELRPTANGNYIKTANTTAANLKALDDKIGSAASAAGTYTTAANTVNQNIKALDTQTKANTDAISDLDENKANKDASNIDAQVWANVLGVGTVSATDTRLVNGKTVYNAINNVLHDTNTELEVKSVTAKTMETETLTVTDKITTKDLQSTGHTELNTLTVNGESTFKENVTLEKDLSVTGTTNLHDTNVDGDLDVTGKSNFHDDVTMDKDLKVTGNSEVGGNLSVTGTSNLHDTNVDGKLDVTGESAFHDNVTMDKDLSVAGNADVAGNSHVGKDLTVDGKTTLKDLLQVEGDAEFQKNASVGGDLSVTGTSNLKDTNVDGKLDVTGESAFHDNVKMDKDLSVAGNAGVDKNLTVKGKSDLQGDVAVGGKLDVAGESTFKENVSMEKDLAVAGNADVAGNGSFGGDLTVTGKTTLKDLLSVAGDAEFQKNASVGGDFSVAGASNLHDTNIDGKLDVTGESAFHDNVKMDKNLSVAGNAGVDKNLTVKGKSDLQGDVAVGGKLDVAKAATFEDTVTMEKDLNVKGNADISGNQSVGGDLSVVGLADFGNDVTMQKNLSVAGDTKMEGNADVGKDLHVAGDANFDKDVTVGGTARFGQAIWNEGEENQVEINDTGVRVGLNSTHMDAHGIYAGGHNWDEAKAAMHEDGRIKGIYGSIEKDLEVGGDATVGGTLTADRAVIGGKDVTGEFRRVDDKIAKVGAGAAALAGLQYHAFEEGSKFSMALGMGHYSGKTAGAVGAQYHFNRNVSMNLAGTVGNGENMVSGGLTFRFGASKTPYQKDNDALRRENRELMKRLNNLEKRMEKLSLIEQKKAAFPDIPTDHWARNAAETLKGNGFVEGYPDGEFKGDRRMTRYEYAQMLYRALRKGATVDEEHLKEYEPELRRIHKEKSKQQSIKNAQAAQEQAVKEQAAREQVAREQAAREQAALEAQATAQVQQDTAINEAQAPAQPVEQQVVNSEMLPMQPGMSRYDYAQQLFTVLRNGGMIDRSLAQEYEPELKQIIREERAKGTLPQQ